MLECFYDLHIHSALSPCADDDMTPYNIVNMALLKKLDIIALTDHNSAKNVEATMKVAKGTDLLVIPGMEVESFEGIHLLCFFRTLNDIINFDRVVYDSLPKVENNETIWGNQFIINEHTEIVGKEKRALSNPVNLKINAVIDLAHIYNGIVFPAHIDRYANSIITVLGFIPNDLKIHGIELQDKKHIDKYRYRTIVNSDAHFLGDICERINKIVLKNKTVSAFFEYFEV